MGRQAEVSGHTSGPVGHNVGFRLLVGREAAQEGITGGSENGEEGADRLAEEGTTTDAGTVGDYIPSRHRAAGREMLAGLHEDAEEDHGEACPKAVPAVPESDHG